MIQNNDFFGSQYIRNIFIVVTFFSAVADASENSLAASVAMQENYVDNYLFTEKNQQSLMGINVIPKLSFSHRDEINEFAVDLQDAIEQYSKPELNNDNPTYFLHYRHGFERTTVLLNYSDTQESTRTTEAADSGQFVTGISLRRQHTTDATIQYQLDERNILVINSVIGSTNYENDAYADLTNYRIAPTWQIALTEKFNFYTEISFTDNESVYRSLFYIEPVEVKGYWLCPPNNFRVGDVCVFSARSGRSHNDAETKGIATGFIWDLQEHLKLTTNAGLLNTKTIQKITTPISQTEFGAPIDGLVKFGGVQTIESTAISNSTTVSLAYTQEISQFKWSLSEQIQPSSTGTLWDAKAVQFNVKRSLSERESLELSVGYTKLLNLDKKIVSQANGDREFYQATIKYGFQLMPAWLVNISADMNRQTTQTDRLIDTNSKQLMLSLIYMPNEWIW